MKMKGKYKIILLFVILSELFVLIVHFIYLKSKIVKTIPLRELDIQRDIACKNCSHFNFNLLISNTKICHTTNTSSINIIILIASAQRHFVARQTLRKTWLSPWKGNNGIIRYVFLLGWTRSKKVQKYIMEEHAKYGDILQHNFTDSYYNLTLKTMMGFQWVLQTCPDVQYVFKTDDDTFVNVKNLIKMSQNYTATLQSAIAGHCVLNATPDRNFTSKWYISKELYPFSVFPGYCSGSGYITSIDVIKAIVHQYHNIPFIFLEDVFIGFCISVLGYDFIDNTHFHSGLFRPVSCAYKGDDLVTSHYINPALMTEIWKWNCDHTLKKSVS